ncbi:MAG: DinB family protein [Terriglobales bacterium]
MSEIKLIADQLNRAFDGEAWHGPALMEILDGVDGKTAAGHPIPNAHSIWELVLHLTTWERVIARRIQGEALMPSEEENFPSIQQPTEPAWREAIKTLRATHSELVQFVSTMKESRLIEPVPGKDYDLRFMLTGAVQHAAYHGGQIALLKKLQDRTI